MRQAEPEWGQAVFLDRSHLAERPRVSVGQERRIIAEAGGAARRPYQSSVGARLDLFEMTVGPGDAQRGNEMRAALPQPFCNERTIVCGPTVGSAARTAASV